MITVLSAVSLAAFAVTLLNSSRRWDLSRAVGDGEVGATAVALVRERNRRHRVNGDTHPQARGKAIAESMVDSAHETEDDRLGICEERRRQAHRNVKGGSK